MECPHCGYGIPAETVEGETICPSCAKQFTAFLFEPPRAIARAQSLGTAGPDGSTPCAHHEGNLAVTSCEHCGTFICGLCATEIDSRTLCPPCFDRLRSQGELDVVEKFRDYGSMASTSVAGGCLIIYFVPILAPLAIYWSIRALRQKKKHNERDGLIGIWAALLLAVAQLGVALLMFVAIAMAVAS